MNNPKMRGLHSDGGGGGGGGGGICMGQLDSVLAVRRFHFDELISICILFDFCV